MDASIIITYKCNARCRMCNTWMYPTSAREEIKPVVLEKLPQLEFCNITGGEPFLRDDIDEVVEIIRRKAGRVVISTNGYLTDKIVEVARNNRDIGFRVSIEGLPSTNDKMRGLTNGFEHGLRTLLRLRSLGLKDIGFGITISDDNTNDLLDLYRLAKSMDFEFATAAVHNSYYFHKTDNLIKRPSTVASNFEELTGELLNSRRIKNWYRAYFNHGLVNHINGGKRLLPCEAGTSGFFIDPWGEVRPCNGMEEKYWFESFGNLNYQDWHDIWHGPKADDIREKVRNCPKNCWMIGNVSPVMKKYIWKPTGWIIKNKILGYKHGLNIAVVGTRGFPGVQGGIESHCQKLYPRLVKAGLKIRVYGRRGYLDRKAGNYQGVEIISLPAPRLKGLEALFHTLIGVMHAVLSRKHFDLIHIHAIGPSLLAPLAKLFGKRVIVTNHGPDYDRQKWGVFARWFLRAGETMGMLFADGIIAVSKTIASRLKKDFESNVTYIPNGVEKPEFFKSGDYLDGLGLRRGKYILAVGRFVPEKGFHDLLRAFSRIDTDWTLAIAGDADHEDSYSRSLKESAAADSRVVLTGTVKGKKLGELYSNAGLFVLPSYHEGLPIVLLEALSYNLDILCSAIPANIEIIDDPSRNFTAGNTDELAKRLSDYLNNEIPGSRPDYSSRLREYDWDCIAELTYELYRKVLGIRPARKSEKVTTNQVIEKIDSFAGVHRQTLTLSRKKDLPERVGKH